MANLYLCKIKERLFVGSFPKKYRSPSMYFKIQQFL